MEANASRYHGKAPEEIEWAQPERRTRAVREYLAALEADAEPSSDRKPPKVISPSDPCAAWTAKANKRVQFGYGLNYLVDIENAVIVDVEPTPARTYDEVQSTKSCSIAPNGVSGPEAESGSRPIRLMGLAVSSVGWSATGSRRISRCAMPASAMMGPSLAVTFAGTSGAGLHLPQQQGAAYHRDRVRRHLAPLSRLKARLRCLSVEDAVLSEYVRATGSPRSP